MLLFLTVVLTIVVMVLDQSYNLFEGGCILSYIINGLAASISTIFVVVSTEGTRKGGNVPVVKMPYNSLCKL